MQMKIESRMWVKKVELCGGNSLWVDLVPETMWSSFYDDNRRMVDKDILTLRILLPMGYVFGSRYKVTVERIEDAD